MPRLFFAAVVVTVLSACLFAQNMSAQGTADDSTPPGARAVMLKFIELNNKQALQSEESKQIRIGDAAKWTKDWIGQTLNPPDKILMVEPKFAVARVQTQGPGPRDIDAYIYLTYHPEAGGWKISRVRAMALTQFAEAAYNDYKSRDGALSLAEKEEFANVQLVLSSDKDLIAWFTAHKAELEKLALTAKAETVKPPPPPAPKPKPVRVKDKHGRVVEIMETVKGTSAGGGGDDPNGDEPRTLEYIHTDDKKFVKTATGLRSLHLREIETIVNGNVKFTIGGMVDNSVGFFYSPTNVVMPIDGWRYIWVEKVAPGWYLFRTT